MRSTKLLFVILALALNTGCATPSKALWRASASWVGFEGVDRGMPTDSAKIEVFFKQGFGLHDVTTNRRYFACATTTVLRKPFLVDTDRSAEFDRDHVALAHVTTEEFPRDEKASRLEEPGEFGTLFGIGTTPMELFDVALDPAFLDDALGRLRYYAAQLGADAVIEVFATGEAEFHMWEGVALSFNTRSPHSPIYSGGTLLDFRLRDVRLHGIAVRYED